jgi:hypothetical protein
VFRADFFVVSALYYFDERRKSPKSKEVGVEDNDLCGEFITIGIWKRADC